MKYVFANLKNGQISDGYVVIQVVNHEAVIDAADYAAILLAEKNGGELVVKKAEAKKGDTK